MNLKQFDNKLVRITDIDDEVFEGICRYDNVSFNECEYGQAKQSLQILCYKIYEDSIKSVEFIEDDGLPYGKTEERLIHDDFDLIEEELMSDNDYHILRLLNCMSDHINNKTFIDNKDKLLELLNDLIKYKDDENIREKAVLLYEKLVQKG